MKQPATVRETVWPWDQPVAAPRQRPLWARVLIQMLVMTAVAGLFYSFGKIWVTAFIVALAIAFLVLACTSATLYHRKEMALLRFAHLVGQALTYGLLVPFYLLCFVPGRLLLRIRGIDPLNRAFPCPDATCWKPKPPATGSYERQY